MRPEGGRGIASVARPAVLYSTDIPGAEMNGCAMYGLIGNMTATPGQREALTAVLLENLGTMPGCLSYIVAHDPADDHAVWVTEVWTNEAAHRASLQVPEVKAAIHRAMQLMATFADAQVTTPVGGVGFR